MPTKLRMTDEEKKQLKGMTFARQHHSEVRMEDSEGDEVTFSFASNEPYERYWYTEVLSMEKDAGNLSRLNDGGAWLFNHNRNILLGSTQKAWMEPGEGRAYVTTRWSSRDDVKGYRQDMEDGHLRNVSFAYDYLEWVETKDSDVLTVTKWEAFEVSLVTIPADPTVGVGRDSDRPIVYGSEKPQIFVMPKKELEIPAPTFASSVETKEEDTEMPETLSPDEIRQQEVERVQTLQEIAAAHNCKDLLPDAIKDINCTPSEFRKLVLDEITKRGMEQVGLTQGPLVDLDEKQKRDYSVVRLIRALESQDKKHLDQASLEIEASEEIAKLRNKTPGTNEAYVPTRSLNSQTEELALRAGLERLLQRDTYEVQTQDVGGVTVETRIYPNLIDFLRNIPMVNQFGAQSWTGLEGNLDVLRQLTYTNVGWIGEDEALPESNATFESFQIRPHDVGAWSRITRRMLQQSSIDIENFVRKELMTGIALELDRVALHGSGVGQEPRGLINVPGVGVVVLGANGGPVDWDAIVDLETAVAAENALLSNLGYMTAPQVRGKLKKTLKNPGGVSDYVWMDTGQMTPSGNMGMLNGYRAGSTNQVRTDLTKGTGTNLASMFFGDWSNIICAYWDGLKIAANPYGYTTTYGSDFLKDAVAIKAIQTMDVQVTRPIGFSMITDIDFS